MIDLSSQQKADPALLKAIEKAKDHDMTPEEIYEQRVSFILAGVKPGSKVTRADIEDFIAKREGRKLSPVK